ncbi:MAG: glutamate racemase [Gammaproteobacteria bacterium]|nr:glutamate racemase [Gammaproteobacteria bacterium]
MPGIVSHPIGVFDSGVGGLSVLRQIRHLLPAEDLLYVADTAWVPYGPRPPEQIRERARVVTGWLVEQGVKAVVVACNTATAAAVAGLREQFAQPVVGMEPAVKPAAAATRNGVVGVLATAGTLKSTRFAALLARFAEKIEVISRPSPELVELVEHGDINSAHAQAVVRDCVAPLLEHGADTLILGCTHFPPLRPLIEAAAGPDVAVIDTGGAVARQVQRRLAETGQLRSPDHAGRVRILTTGPVTPALPAIRAIWGEEPVPEAIAL